MNMKSFSDIVKLHQEFSAMLTEQEKDLRERRKGTIDEMLPEMRAALKQAKAELDAVHRAKTEAVKRFDGEARRHEQTIAELESHLEELAKAKRGKKDIAPDKPVKRPPE